MCSFLRKEFARREFLILKTNARCALRALNGEAGRAFQFLSARWYYQLDRRAFIAEDRGQHPDGRPIFCSAELRPRNSRSEFHFLKEAPVLDPRPESALPYRIRKKPAGGPSPARAEFTCARVA